MPQPHRDDAGPTAERYRRAGFEPASPGKPATDGFYTIAGRAKATRKVTMLDDALGKAWMRRKISDAEYYSLKRYALHWLAGGLQGPMQSVDLNRIFAFDPGAMSGLAKSERQQDHRDAYRAAKCEIGRRPAFVADQVACAGSELFEVGVMLGYKSPWHARDEARKILSDAGYRLARFWKDRDR